MAQVEGMEEIGFAAANAMDGVEKFGSYVSSDGRLAVRRVLFVAQLELHDGDTHILWTTVLGKGELGGEMPDTPEAIGMLSEGINTLLSEPGA